MTFKSDQKTSERLSGWKQKESLYWKTYGELQPFTKIAAFDFDGTLITTRSGSLFPKDTHDWQWLHAEKIPQQLKELAQKGFTIIIITNQLGISLKYATLESITDKIDECQKQLQVPLTALVATSDDLFRKPRTGSWDFFLNLVKTEYPEYRHDSLQCFFVGDADGIRRGRAVARDCDLKFAINSGIQFFSTYSYFLGEQFSAVPPMAFHPRKLFRCDVPDASFLKLARRPCNKRKIIILIGSPSSGKSTICLQFFPEYFRINQDELKTKTACHNAFKKALECNDKSVIIDNQNRTVEDRKIYIDLAKMKESQRIEVGAIFLKIPKVACMHMNKYRHLTQYVIKDEGLSIKKSAKVPDVAIHKYYKFIEEPTITEGFDFLDVVDQTSNIPLKFASEQYEKLFFQHLQ